ncbi:MAG: LTA synthase family protein [Spirochaetota bacterium]
MLVTICLFLLLYRGLFYFLFQNHIIHKEAYILSAFLEIYLLYFFFYLHRIPKTEVATLAKQLLSLFFVSLVLLFLADFIYFLESNKHIGYEVLLLSDRIGLFFIRHGLMENWRYLLFFLLFFVSSYTLSHKFFSDLKVFSSKTVTIGLILSVGIFCYKGKLLFLHNPIHSIVYSFSETTLPGYLKNSRKKNVELMQDLLDSPRTKFIDPEYPLFRRSVTVGKERKKNVVVLILESWTAKYTDRNIAGINTTPNFSNLSKEGMIFAKAFATGNRTANGLVSILLGFPDLPQKTLLKTRYVQNRFYPLSRIFHSKGYKTFFISTSFLRFENIYPHLQRWGFATVINQDMLRRQSQQPITDRTLYREILKKVKRVGNTPFFIVALTSSSHFPYHLPYGGKKVFSNSVEEYNFLNTIHFADKAIGDFINDFKKLPQFKDTVFLFIADHTFHRRLNLLEDRHIPFLVYSPGFVRPQKVDKITSQVDITPLIVDLLQLKTRFVSTGTSPLSPGDGHAFFAFSRAYGFISPSGIYINHYLKNNRDTLYTNHDFHTNLCRENAFTQVCKRLQRTSFAYLDFYTDSIERNLIVPQAKSRGSYIQKK